MFRAEEILLWLQEADDEAIQRARTPDLEQQSAFGFGRVSGMMLAVARIREKLNEAVEQQAAEERSL